MALIYEDYCVGCPAELCRPMFCKQLNRPRHVCDRCGAKGPVYDWNGEELCRMCVWEDLELKEIE